MVRPPRRARDGLNYPNGLGSAPRRLGAGPARRHITVRERTGEVLIAGACVFAAAWYVPGIVAADGRSLAGTVTSNGTIYLNFSASGQLAKITARTASGSARDNGRPPRPIRPGPPSYRGPGRNRRRPGTGVRPGALPPACAPHRASPAGQGQGPAGRRPGAGRRHPDLRAVRRDRGCRRTASRARPPTPRHPRLFGPAAGTAGHAAAAVLPVSRGPAVERGAGAAVAAASLPVIALRTSSTWQVIVLVPENRSRPSGRARR